MGIAYMSLFVSNIEDLVAEVVQFGGQVAIPVTEFRPGARFAFVEDPEGNRIELLDVAAIAARYLAWATDSAAFGWPASSRAAAR